MELKSRAAAEAAAAPVCSNRTFMELKFGDETAVTDGIEGSNRTFMELKLRKVMRHRMTIRKF